MRAAVLCFLVGIAASQAVYQRPQNQDCVANSTIPTNTPTNFFPGEFQSQGLNKSLSGNRVNVTFAQGFSVTYFDTYKIVTNSQVNETYVLYQCGLTAPNNALLPPGAKVFSIPLTSVAVGDTVPLAFLDLLGVDARLQSASQYATNACGQKLVGCGKVAPNTTTISNSSLLQADYVPLVDGITLSAANSVSQTFAFTAASDPGVLNRAEWIKFLGLFFNQDALASQVFNSINSSYYDTAADIQSTLTEEEEEDPPVMAFVDFYDYGEDEAYEISFAQYKLQYTEAAAAQPLNMSEVAAIPGVTPGSYTPTTLSFGWSNSTPGNFPSQLAAKSAYFDVLSQVDVLIDETYAFDPTSYNFQTFLNTFGLTGQEPYPFLQTRRVYREDGLVSAAPNYGLDWFEGAISRPDLVLLDFAAAVRPQEYPGYNATWIRNIAEGVPVQITLPQECSAIPSCSVAPVPICPFVQSCPSGGTRQQLSVDSPCVYSACSQ